MKSLWGFLFPLLVILIGGGGCLRVSPPAGPEQAVMENTREELTGEFPTLGGYPDLILKTGPLPLWFEFGEEGPRQIFSPGEASLKPFSPWPLSRYGVALLAQGGRLVIAVNREGFLTLAAGNGAAAGYTGLRRTTDSGYWGNYTAGALFLLGDIPAAFLYRNDFFSDPSAAPAVPPLWGLLPGADRPAPLQASAFEGTPSVPPEEGWEPDSLRRGPDGFWYYRMTRKNSPQPGIRYLRTADLREPGGEVSLAAYRNSAQPEPSRRAPPVLAETLEGAFLLAGRESLNIASVVSPEFSAPRYFAPQGAGAGGEGVLRELSGFYQEDFPGRGAGALPCALVILPDGRGLYHRAQSALPESAALETGRFSLPPLAEGFAYTGLGCTGSALIALWEERQEGSLGAAGFMAIELSALLPLP